MSTNGMERMFDVIKQLQNKEGPYYNQWLRCYREAVKNKCNGADNRWAQGVKSFLAYAEKDLKKRRNKRGNQ